MSRYQRNAGATFSLKYHLVWCPKYRRAVLTPPFDARLKEIIRAVADEAVIKQMTDIFERDWAQTDSGRKELKKEKKAEKAERKELKLVKSA